MTIERPPSPSPPPPPAHFVMLVAIDDSSFANQVANAAIGFQRIIPGVEMHVLHVLEQWRAASVVPIPDDMPGNRNEWIESGRALVRRIGDTIQSRSGARVVAHLAVGEAWREIVQMGANIDADLVLVGTHGRKGLGRLVLGSVAEHVTRACSCPVLVVRPKAARVVPEIEPACSDCLRVQRETSRAKLWCERHSLHHPHAHLHYEMPQGFAEGSTLIVT